MGGAMGLISAALVLGFCVQTQDDPKPPTADIVWALQKTSKRGAFAFAGQLKTEVNPDDADEETVVCTVSGGVSPGALAVVEIKGDASVHELVLKRDKMAGRETWKGHSLDLLNGPSELFSLLDLARLAVQLNAASAANALPDEKVGGEDCSAYELLLPKEAIRSYHDDAETAGEEEKTVRKLNLRLRVRKSDGMVVSLDAVVRRLYKDDDKPAAGTKGVSSFTLTFKDFGAASVTIPPGLEKLLKE